MVIKQVEVKSGCELEIELWKSLAIRLGEITQRLVEKRAPWNDT